MVEIHRSDILVTEIANNFEGGKKFRSIVPQPKGELGEDCWVQAAGRS